MELKPIETPKQLIDAAFSRASREAAAAKKPVQKERRVKVLELRKINIVSTFLEERLRAFVRDVPSIAELHPFYRELMSLTVDLDAFKKGLGHVESVAGLIKKLAREHARRVQGAKNDDLAWKARKQFYARVDSMVRSLEGSLSTLNEARKKLREVPKVRFDLPTVVLAGYPNTGKSTLLKRLTSSAPEIAPYPFTTKGIKLGYYSKKYLEIQVADTPGLLDRPIEKRNAIEKKALTALKHLTEVIVFVLDPTDGCGYPLDKQLHLLAEMRAEFQVPFLVAVNKADVARPEQLEAAKKAGNVIIEGEGLQSGLRDAVFAAIDWTKFNKREAVFTPVTFGEPAKTGKAGKAGSL
ncbi:MAG TPA: hypothetical protein HA252_01355 [Candidatus Diapherotrites archaeon]|uniref:50S ribosome-binding GTPase n=1 Tax=Candidatus Iainarchaeum sp. TaxID=3101447 RepID=A0A7J4JE47_9ARCH|nr:50S ribosome-binding GTPase [Candidatus Diapherotrites archaeon]HIH16031.1 hypothetical protein [Candidatus Diapherotrites archaeon]